MKQEKVERLAFGAFDAGSRAPHKRPAFFSE
jgi:hypothetical protein